VALNIADLAEHAIDAVPDRVALICGEEQLTYAQLEEKANRLAHYLQEQGVQKDDKVGLYCRNRIEIVIAMLGIVKAGAILVNVNYRYVEGELRYLFDNSDMVALVHERQYSERVANVLPDTPNVKTVLVVEDGSDADYTSYGGVEFYAAIADWGVVAFRKLLDELVSERRLRSLDHLFPRKGRLAVSDIVCHRIVEEKSLLRDQTNCGSQRLQRVIANVVTVDPDGAHSGISKPRNETGESGLAGAARTDERHNFARANFERHARELPT